MPCIDYKLTRFVVLLLLLLVGACMPVVAPAEETVSFTEAGSIPEIAVCVDPDFSAISAHGNAETDFKNAADVFVAPNAITAGWSPIEHRHVAMSHTSAYYYDSNLAGSDTNGVNGIDQAMLFFYAGHGEPTSWDTLGDTASQDKMRLGNCTEGNGGKLRYYWQCSCQVFAHGPDTCTNSTTCYTNPGTWSGGVDSPAMRNIYTRWGPSLDPKLRMACGASTDVVCNDLVARQIWSNKLFYHFDVADAFIDGLIQSESTTDYAPVALCITLGGKDVAATPLVTDQSFTTAANSAGDTHYHIEYSDVFTSTPTRALAYGLKPLLPGADSSAEDPVPEMLPILKVDADKGIEYHQGESRLDLGVERSEAEYIMAAQQSLARESLDEPDRFYVGPFGTHLRLASTLIEPSAGADNLQSVVQKNVLLNFKRRIDLSVVPGVDMSAILDYNGEPIHVVGPGGIIKLQLNNGGSLLNATKIWREIADGSTLAPVKQYAQAFEEAQGQLEDVANAYVLDHWFWGYREEAADVRQSEMRIFYEFWFVPDSRKEFTSRNYPPRLIVIPGQE